MKSNILDTKASCVDKRFVRDINEVVKKVEALKVLGQKIGLTQGVFDVAHVGHGRYLENGKGLCDFLIVGVDSDEMTRKRKGPRRPVVPEDERIEMLCLLRSVDLVTLRNIDDDIDGLIKLLQPDILILSESTKDYDNFTQVMKEKVAVFSPGTEVYVLEPQAETSTTKKLADLVIGETTDLGNLIVENVTKAVTQTVEDFVTKLKI